MSASRRDFLKRSVVAATLGGIVGETATAGEDSGEIAFQRRVPVRYDVDVFVAGGGPAGIAATVAAARQGAKVFLAERNLCFGGMGTAGMLPLFMTFTDGKNMLAGGVGEEILNRLRACGGDGPAHGTSIRAELLKRVYDELLLESNAAFQLQTDLIAVECDNGRVSSVILAGKSGLFAVRAKVFLDCTGDGDLAAWAGAPFEKGDDRGDAMAGTLCSLWADVEWDSPELKELRKSDESRLPDAIRDKLFTTPDLHLPGMYRVGARLGGGNVGHAFGVDGTDERSITQAAIRSRRILLEYERYYKEYLKGFEQMELAATASQLGIRESRRILGDYVLNVEDFKSRAVFPDEIGRYCYGIDVHAGRPGGDAHQKFLRDFESLRYGPGESYGIPYRSLVPQKLKNVLVGGRCISTDRMMLGSIRVMPGCFITGQAIGVAAAMAATQGGDVRGVSVPDLQKRLKAAGAYLPNC